MFADVIRWACLIFVAVVAAALVVRLFNWLADRVFPPRDRFLGGKNRSWL